MTSANPYQPPSSNVEPPQPVTSIDVRAFVPGGARATAAVATLWIAAATHAAAVATQIYRMIALAKLNTPAFNVDDLRLSDQLNLGVSVLHLLALAGCAVAFCIWFYNAYRNARHLGGYCRYSPGWAPGSFFVPIMNLYRPFQIAKEIWLACTPLEEAYQDRLSNSPVTLWWALFVTGNLVSNAAARNMRPDSVDSIQICTFIMTMADLVLIGAAIAAVRVVKGIERRQAARASVADRLPEPVAPVSLA